MDLPQSIILLIFNIWSLCPISLAINEIVLAINAGGPEHVDVHNIYYQSDLALPVQGIASDYGKRYVKIGRAYPEDQILYQTERYSMDNFEYRFKLEPKKIKDGDYVIVLKFSEVYFNAPGEKIFSVSLNNHDIVENLDIYSEAGLAVAIDKIVPFTIKNNKLTVMDEISDFDGTFLIRFKKGPRDNPKVNAFYIMRGTREDVPPMPELEEDEELHRPEDYIHKQEEDIITEDEAPEVQAKYASGPQISDPYAQQEVSQMFIPILIALACFFPILFCLCRL